MRPLVWGGSISVSASVSDQGSVSFYCRYISEWIMFRRRAGIVYGVGLCTLRSEIPQVDVCCYKFP